MTIGAARATMTGETATVGAVMTIGGTTGIIVVARGRGLGLRGGRRGGMLPGGEGWRIPCLAADACRVCVC